MLIKEIPPQDRPRERLISCGSAALSDQELLAIVLTSGVGGQDVLKISSELLPLIDAQWETLSSKMLQTVAGIGETKASQIIAALEFARRRIRPHGHKIRQAKDVLPLISYLGDRKQEHFICISLNGAHEVIATRVVTIGLVNATQVHPREVFSDPICDRASAIIVAHNHPSGQLEPSSADMTVTRNLKEAGELLGIKLLDHIIFSAAGFYSFVENNNFDSFCHL